MIIPEANRMFYNDVFETFQSRFLRMHLRGGLGRQLDLFESGVTHTGIVDNDCNETVAHHVDIIECLVRRMVGWMVGGCLGGWLDGLLRGWLDGWLGGWLDGWSKANRIVERMFGQVARWLVNCLHGL